MEKHIENINKFGVPVVVAINDYVSDTEKEHNAIINFCKNLGVQCKISSHWEKGGQGASDLAEEVAKVADSNMSEFKTLYDNICLCGIRLNISLKIFMELKILLLIKKLEISLRS